MKPFMSEDFLLDNDTARTLYHKYAASLPILDYHCHIDPKEIAENRSYENITRIWLGGDHYKWRLMRANGVPESFITGEASDKEKFMMWARTVGRAIGSPVYHWTHLELRRYFQYDGILNERTAEDVWTLCNKILQCGSMTVRDIIQKSRVSCICTTDDPVDTLEWHRDIAEDPGFDVRVLPAWRPDKAMNLEVASYPEYIHLLSQASDTAIHTFDDLKAALSLRMDFFSSMGCVISDHGLEFVMFEPASDAQIQQIFSKRLQGILPTREETLQFKTAFMMYVGAEYARRGWAMQLHYGCKRNNNTQMFQRLGPDTGFDCISNHTPSAQLTDFLNALSSSQQLPKTVLYSLNPQDNQTIVSIAGCFSEDGVINKVSHGSAWWFNDHITGMVDQLTSLGNLGLLSGHLGMLTDSRSFLSYPRHEYFRRIVCNLFGTWVERGEFPNDMETLGSIVQDISFHNANRYFNLLPTSS